MFPSRASSSYNKGLEGSQQLRKGGQVKEERKMLVTIESLSDEEREKKLFLPEPVPSGKDSKRSREDKTHMRESSPETFLPLRLQDRLIRMAEGKPEMVSYFMKEIRRQWMENKEADRKQLTILHVQTSRKTTGAVYREYKTPRAGALPSGDRSKQLS